ncbi:MAG TPA: CoA transferase [Pseudolabrys sp.]|nr:CoA transferase [Pseudolabrys sp.]
MTGPLDGLKVVECSIAMAGPYCGLMLGDYGADVVKIEQPDHGDESRNWPPFVNGSYSHYFAAVNRNKRSLAVDLKSPEGVAVMRKLALSADVLIDNFRLGTLDRLGFGYEQLSAVNPRLIYCRVTGFGATGPRAAERANDAVVQAYSGGMSLTGEPDGGPVKMGISVADIGAGLFSTIGVLMALEMRHRTGRGQLVDTSLLEGQMAMLTNHFSSYFASGKVPPRRGSSGQGMVPYQAFHALDGWMVVAAFTDRMWCGVCNAIERPEWGADPRYHNAAGRFENREPLIAQLSAIFSTRSVDEWEKRLTGEGVPFTRVNTIDQVAVDEQALAREMIQTITHPEVGDIKMIGLPIKFSDTSGVIRQSPPLLGEHSAQIVEELGYGPAEIDAMVAGGVIQVPAASRARQVTALGARS